jgi:hypothetical protein
MLGLHPLFALQLYRMGLRTLGDIADASGQLLHAVRESIGDELGGVLQDTLEHHRMEPCIDELPSSHRGDLATPSPPPLAAAHFELPFCGHLDHDFEDWDGMDWVAWIEGMPDEPRWCPDRTHRSSPPNGPPGPQDRAVLKTLAEWRMEQVRIYRSSIRDALHRSLLEHGRPLHFQVLTAMARDRFPEFAITASDVYSILHESPLFVRVGRGVFQAGKAVGERR